MKKPLLAGIAILFSLFACQQEKSYDKEPMDKQWWKEEIVYQIYPRSFKDSNGDGVGDLKGIISKLDYLYSLGITAVWLNPIFQSPNYDNGYDISDYRAIQPEYGTMDDFDQLLKGLHDRGIKLIMDLVVNHSSSEHEWFKQSRSSRDNPYRDYYHWWPAERGKPTPRWSFFDVNSDAWKYDSLTDAYYLHYFAVQQPDLNWANPKVRQEVYDIMRFWADKGIDGFRIDAFQFAAKDPAFPVLPVGYEKNIAKYYGMQPGLHDYLKEMNREVLSQYDVLSVAEGAGTTFEDAHALVDADRKELNMAYHFEGIDIGRATGEYELKEFKELYSRWDSAFAHDGWLAIFLANHDNARMVSRFGNDSGEYRELSSKMLTTFIMTMRGTPFYYYGDELGMTNIRFDNIEDYKDIDTRNRYEKLVADGGDVHAFLEREKLLARDNGRTPFQWDDSQHGGFTSGSPWLKVNPNYKTINASVQENDTQSVLNYFRKMTQLRKDNPVLIYGKYTLLDKDNDSVYAYLREGEGDRILVMLNFTDQEAETNVGFDVIDAELISSNYPNGMCNTTLRPYEAKIIRLP